MLSGAAAVAPVGQTRCVAGWSSSCGAGKAIIRVSGTGGEAIPNRGRSKAMFSGKAGQHVTLLGPLARHVDCRHRPPRPASFEVVSRGVAIVQTGPIGAIG